MKKPVAVTEEDYKKDPDNVRRIETPIPGFPDAEPLITYVRVETLDDLTEKPAQVETVPLLVPVQKEQEEVVRGADGEPEKNADGTDKLQVTKYWDFEARELDLSEASVKKLAAALKPFMEKSRPRAVAVPRQTLGAKAPGAAGHDTRAIREWASKAGHDVNPKGKVPNRIIDLYYENNPDVKRPEGA